MKSYPKIETLFKRNEDTFKVTDQVRCPEFENIKSWLITEKIDGTNIRIILDKDYDLGDGTTGEGLFFRGRTDKAQMPSFLLEELKRMFSLHEMQRYFERSRQVCLYGEGYGARIQKGGGNYREGVSFRLIDVWIDGWWLRWDDVEEIATQLEIKTVPNIGIMSLSDAVILINNTENYVINSRVAIEENNRNDVSAEGIVARSHPLVLFRNGNPVVWKLKAKDF